MRDRHDRSDAHFGSWSALLLKVSAGDHAGMSLEDALIELDARLTALETSTVMGFSLQAWILGATIGTVVSFSLQAWLGTYVAPTTTGELGASQSMLGNIELGGP